VFVKLPFVHEGSVIQVHFQRYSVAVRTNPRCLNLSKCRRDAGLPPQIITRDFESKSIKEDVHMRRRILFTVAGVMLSSLAGAQPEVVIGPGLGSGRTIYHQNFDRTLSSDTTYLLTGLYVVDSTRALTIEAGTIIKGDTAATLVVARGSQIFAEGTVSEPVVFTSMKEPGSREPGDWGGVVILGSAPTNQANPLIEGGIIPGTYGGGAIGAGDPDDDSGVFSYVRIEFPGYRFQPNNEVNGLTCGGVGRGTQIDHVQVSYSFDDSFEWFGGTVDCNNLVALGGTDDDWDTDFGFQGRLQFLFGLRDPNYSELSGVGQSNGFESDNEGTASVTEPRTLPRFSNVTEVGPRRTDAHIIPGTPQVFEYGVVARRGTELSIYNSVVMGYQGGYSMRDEFTMLAAQGDILQGRNISLQEDGTLNTLHTSGTIPPGFDLLTWYNSGGWGNLGSTDRLPSTIGLVDMSDLSNPDPRPGVGSEPATAGTEFTNLNALAGGYFTVTGYRGAFDPALTMEQQWTAAWTNFDPQNADYTTGVKSVGNPLPGSFMLQQNYPNPFNPSTRIQFSVVGTGQVVLAVYNLLGEEVATLVNEVLPAGNYETTFSGESLPSGIYMYRITANGSSQTRRMILLK